MVDHARRAPLLRVSHVRGGSSAATTRRTAESHALIHPVPGRTEYTSRAYTARSRFPVASYSCSRRAFTALAMRRRQRTTKLPDCSSLIRFAAVLLSLSRASKARAMSAMNESLSLSESEASTAPASSSAAFFLGALAEAIAGTGGETLAGRKSEPLLSGPEFRSGRLVGSESAPEAGAPSPM